MLLLLVVFCITTPTGIQNCKKMNRKLSKKTKTNKKKRAADHFRSALDGTQIPTVTLNDIAALQQTRRDVTTCLMAIDKLGLPGKFKAWMYQHGVLGRLLWLLLVYEVPVTTMEALEGSISHFLLRWLGLPQQAALPCMATPPSCTYPSVAWWRNFKVTRSREAMMYMDSTDTKSQVCRNPRKDQKEVAGT